MVQIQRLGARLTPLELRIRISSVSFAYRRRDDHSSPPPAKRSCALLRSVWESLWTSSSRKMA
jgi:hypothetical protein